MTTTDTYPSHERPEPVYRRRSGSGRAAGRRPGIAERTVALTALALLLFKLLLERWLLLDSLGTIKAIAVDGLFVAVVLGIGLLVMRRRLSFVWVLLASLLLSAIMLTTAVYAEYFDQVVGPDALTLAGQAGEMTGAISDMLKPVHALYLLDMPFLVALMVVSRKRGPVKETQRVPASRRWVYVGVWLAAVVVVAFSARAIATIPGPLDGLSVAREAGVFTFQLASAFHEEDLQGALGDDGETVRPEDPLWVSDKISELKGIEGTPPRLYGVEAGAAAGSNVIIIQVESLQEAIIDVSVDGFEVTPNLNAFADESWYFPNMFAQVGSGNTSDAEFVSNTSLFPPSKDPASLAYVDRVLPALPRLLGEQGYRSVTFHTNWASFWNRSQLYPALGFDEYYDAGFFEDEDDIWFGSSDEVLFRRGLEEVVKIHESGQPFYAQFVTVTSHFPYRALPDRKNPYDPPAIYDETEIGLYLPHINYADQAIGQCIDRLKETGLWDDSIVVIYGDHHGLPHVSTTDREARIKEATFGHPYTYTDRLNVPLMIHLPGQVEGQTVDGVAGTIDIMPTVADLLGLDLTEVPHFGRSVFEDSPVLLAMRRFVAEGSVITSEAVVLSGMDDKAIRSIPLDARTTERETTATELSLLDSAGKLLTLSDAYARALPRRPDYDPDAKATIPGRD